MIVICKKNTLKLIKGKRYELQSIRNTRGAGYVKIKNLGSYTVKNFTDIDNKPLPSIDWDDSNQNYEKVDFSTLKKGDLLIPIYSNSKRLLNGKIYKIVDLRSLEKKPNSYYQPNYVKFEGYDRFLKFNSWCYRKPNKDLIREIQLGSILDNEEYSFVIDAKKRSIEQVDDMNKELIYNIAKSIIDKARHDLSVVDWACQKTGKKLDIKPSDYKELLKMSLGDIIDMVYIKELK
jgi:hypothetical protein